MGESIINSEEYKNNLFVHDFNIIHEIPIEPQVIQ